MSKNESSKRAVEAAAEEKDIDTLIAEWSRLNSDESRLEPEEDSARQGAPASIESEDKSAAVKKSIKGRLRDGHGKPLYALKEKEIELEEKESLRGRLGKAIYASPDANVLVNQIRHATSPSGLGSHLAQLRRNEGISLYASMKPIDPFDSIVVRQMVALNYATMEGYSRAMNSQNAKVRDLELRNVFKATKALAELRKLREEHQKAIGGMITIDLDAEPDLPEPPSRRRLSRPSKPALLADESGRSEVKKPRRKAKR